MKIYINGRFLTQSVTGVQRYAYEIVKEMDALIGSEKKLNHLELVMLLPKVARLKPEFKHIKVVQKGLLGGHLWEQIELPFYAGNAPLINLCNAAPVVKRKQLVTIHDASVFLEERHFSRLFRVCYRLLFRLEARYSETLVTVSHFSEQEILKYLPAAKGKLQVFYEGVAHIGEREADERVLEKHGLHRKPYILAVGSMDSRKNFKGLVHAFAKMKNRDVAIVIAGGTNPRVFQSSHADFPGDVIYLGYVTDHELKALYEHACCFVYPSFYEGFGLPPLEAMALGCPVIVSKRASLPEVCGSAALYCDPDNPDDIADKIDYMLSDARIRDKYRELGLAHARLFSWTTAARGILNHFC